MRIKRIGFSACETFFSDVKVLKKNLVGEEHKGWSIAKYLLTPSFA